MKVPQSRSAGPGENFLGMAPCGPLYSLKSLPRALHCLPCARFDFSPPNSLAVSTRFGLFALRGTPTITIPPDTQVAGRNKATLSA